MKILHVLSGDLWAGAEVQAYSLLTALQQEPGVQVAAALLNEGELARRLRERGIPVTVLPENRLDSLRILSGLRNLMGSWRPDVVHTHRIKENILGSLANRLSGNVPSIRTVHGAPENPPLGLRKLPKRLLHRLDLWCGRSLQQRIIAVSDDMAGKLGAQYARGQVIVIENGVDTQALQSVMPATFRVQEPDATHIGIVGRLVGVKRMDLFLQIAKQLATQEPDRKWRFHVFGEGPLLESLTRQAEALGMSASTRFHGHRGDIATCIAGLDVLVMCSDHEGMPMTLLEAMAIGTPVVGHSVGGIAQLLESDRHGWGVDDHSVGGYARAIGSALAQPEARTARSAAARQNILSRYSAAACARKHVAAYSQLLTIR